MLTWDQESLSTMLNFRLISMTIYSVILLSHAIRLHYFTATWLKLTPGRCKLVIPVLYELIGNVIDGPIQDQVGHLASISLLLIIVLFPMIEIQKGFGKVFGNICTLSPIQ